MLSTIFLMGLLARRAVSEALIVQPEAAIARFLGSD